MTVGGIRDKSRVRLAAVLIAASLVSVADAVSNVVEAGSADGPNFDGDGFTDSVVGVPFALTAGPFRLSGQLVVIYGNEQYSGSEHGTAAFDHAPFEGCKQAIGQNTFDLDEDDGEFDAVGDNFVRGDCYDDTPDFLAAAQHLRSWPDVQRRVGGVEFAGRSRPDRVCAATGASAAS